MEEPGSCLLHVSMHSFRFQPFLTLQNNVNCLSIFKQLSYCPSQLIIFFLSSYILIFDIKLTCFIIILPCIAVGLSRQLRCLRRGSTAALFLGLRVRIPPRAWMSISCESWELSRKGLCVWPIKTSRESLPSVACLSVIAKLQ